MKKTLLTYCLLLILAMVSCDKNSAPQNNVFKDSAIMQDQLNQQKFNKEKNKNNPEVINRDTSEITNVAILKTNFGNIILGLYGKEAPKTVENFINLVDSLKFYDGLLFHRVAYNFLIQAGDKNTKNIKKKADWGKGGTTFSGKTLEDELFSHTTSYKNGYLVGTLAMANKGPNTGTSQFFICLKEAIKLKNKYTIFGRVLEGMPIVEKISAAEITPSAYDPLDGVPVEPIVIQSIRIQY
jgi:cyclophilin family peptidyl-prolyl cis-trans isomerase